MSEYFKSRTFPGGLDVDYETFVERDYLDDRNEIRNKDDLIKFQNKWMWNHESNSNT